MYVHTISSEFTYTHPLVLHVHTTHPLVLHVHKCTCIYYTQICDITHIALLLHCT